MARSREQAREFRKLYNSKNPKSGAATNIVAMYYINKILNQEFVTEEDIKWCHNAAFIHPKVNLKQSLRDLKREQYLNVKSTPMGNVYSITPCGINYYNSILKG